MTIFATGTITIFSQTTAPTGWTKLTDLNDAGIRITSGSVSSGGSVGFTTAFSATNWQGTVSPVSSTGAVTLSAPQLPVHSHTYAMGAHSSFSPVTVTANSSPTATTYNAVYNYPVASSLVASGVTGGGAHSHPVSADFTFTGSSVDLAVKYVDVILASKD